jgi:glucan phosphoethanolaminetransferase (alkaline phosphatase superfamily)
LDIELFKILKNLSKSERKELVVFHLLGSHSNYRLRYEKSIVPFGEKRRIDQYDNSIYYTDYLLSKIYRFYEKKKFLMIYFSDHGEIVSERINGHGFDPAYQEEYEVPFVIVSTVPNPYLDTLKADNNGSPINLENFPCLLQNILNEKEVCDFNASSKVISIHPKNIVDYRKLTRFHE